MTLESSKTPAHAELAGLEAALGHCFTRPELLERALTHRSLANQRAVEAGAGASSARWNNERLEFLGDAVLGLAVAAALFELHPDWQEGELTRVRSQLVSRQHLAQVAASIGLGEFLRLSRGEDRGGLRRKPTVLSNTMEAVLGALFLDGGLGPVQAFALLHVMGETAEQLAQELRSGAALGNYKSALQEYLQAAHLGSPVYRVKDESGPDHRKHFLVEVRLDAGDGEPPQPLARGTGTTKKNAEQAAARRALASVIASTSAISGSAADEQQNGADGTMDGEELTAQ